MLFKGGPKTKLTEDFTSLTAAQTRWEGGSCRLKASEEHIESGFIGCSADESQLDLS